MKSEYSFPQIEVFVSLHPVFSVSSNLACTVCVTQWQHVDVKFVSLMEVYFQCNLSVDLMFFGLP